MVTFVAAQHKPQPSGARVGLVHHNMIKKEKSKTKRNRTVRLKQGTKLIIHLLKAMNETNHIRWTCNEFYDLVVIMLHISSTITTGGFASC